MADKVLRLDKRREAFNVYVLLMDGYTELMLVSDEGTANEKVVIVALRDSQISVRGKPRIKAKEEPTDG